MKASKLYLAAALFPLISFAAYDIVIPEIGETCILDPKTGQCAVNQTVDAPVYVPGSAGDTFEFDFPAPYPDKTETVSPKPLVKPTETPVDENPVALKEIPLPFFDRQEVKDFFREIGIPASVTLAAVSGGALLLTATAGNVQVAMNISNILQILDNLRLQLLGLVTFKKRKPWGKVFEKLNGRPIPGAKVHLFSAEFNKLLDSYITDSEGRFEFLVNSGNYFLKVSGKGFTEKETDPIHIKSAEQVMNQEIFLVPDIKNIGPGTLLRINIFSLLFRFVDFLNPYLLALGTLLSAGAAYSIPNDSNYLILALYGFFDFVKLYLALSLVRPDGSVVDEDKNPVKNAVVRIFDAQKNLLVTTGVSDRNGKFNILLVSGKYYLTCAATGYKPYRSDTINVSKNNLPDLKIRLGK